MSTMTLEPIATPTTKKRLRVFQLHPQKKGFLIRFRYVRYEKGKSVPYAFVTEFAVEERRHWDMNGNRVYDHVPNSRYINEQLKTLYEKAFKLIAEGKTQDEMRVALGYEPTRPRKVSTTRSDKGEIRLETAKQTLLKHGYTQRITVHPQEPLAQPATPEPLLAHPDEVTAGILHKYGNLCADPQPDENLWARRPTPPPVTAPGNATRYLVAPGIILAQDQESRKLSPDTTQAVLALCSEEAVALASQRSRQEDVTLYVWECKPIARVAAEIKVTVL
jgi:hypothetical protein